jgi:hypothetical protein
MSFAIFSEIKWIISNKFLFEWHFNLIEETK